MPAVVTQSSAKITQAG